MTIAVTAASGKLGSAIVRALVQAGEPVIGLARRPENASDLDIEVRPGDYTKPDELRTSLKGVDTLLLVSGMAEPEERIQQHRNVINAASDAGARKIVYTSIQGPEAGTSFSPIVQSNRQTEADVRASLLEWAIGRNGIYIEPDLDYIDNYKASGEIANCAGNGKCGYTTHTELAEAYAHMLTADRHNGRTYNLHGEAFSQTQLATFLNRAFGTDLVYRPMSVAAYQKERAGALGSFLGTIIAGIYEGIRNGAFDNASDFDAATERPHLDWDDFFGSICR